MLTLDTSPIQLPNQPDEMNEPLRKSASHPLDEAALLITCLRGLPIHVPEDADWNALLSLANENGVLLLVYQQLLASSPDMPDYFRDAARERRIATESLVEELEALLQDLADHGVEALPFKGPALALVLYGDAALRQSNDIDLLVRRDDFSSAEALLFLRGFTALGAASEHDRRFVRGGLLVELHFEIAPPRFFSFETKGIWSRSRLSDFRGHPTRAMYRNDLALYLCAHGLKHGFSRLIWILDLARALQGWTACEYQDLLRQAQRQGLRTWLLIGCEVVRTMFPQQLPAALDAAIAASPEALQLARHATARLFSTDQQVVVNDYRSFYLQAEPNPLKRWCYRLRYLVPTQADRRWARQHSIHPGLMVILRPFRLLKKYGPSRAWKILIPPKSLSFDLAREITPAQPMD
jgi:Uncharacterised nucleotidyltransferase